MDSADSHETALITGGSSGIGYEVARELAKRNYNLVLVSNQEKQLKEACDEFTAMYKVKTWPVFMDLTEADAATKLYDWCQGEKIVVEVLVNNAGIFFFGEVVNTDIGKIKNIISLHISTLSLLCTLFGKEMKGRRRGNILNISSISAYLPYPGIALYSATKGFIKNFSRSLRTEMLDYNVNVTCACPGAVSTKLYNLSESGHKKALKTGILMRSEKLAPRIVRAMLKRKSLVIPGFINKIFIGFLFFVPHGIIALIRRHSRLLPPDQ